MEQSNFKYDVLKVLNASVKEILVLKVKFDWYKRHVRLHEHLTSSTCK